MVIKIKNKEYELKYTFNSFRYMEEFDISALDELENKPFKTLAILEVMLMGAVNSDPKRKVPLEEVQVYLEKYIVEGSIPELFENLMNALQESDFFKSLQKK